MRAGLGAFIGALLVAAVLASLALFTVDQRESAIVFQLGEIKEVITQPGLRAKWPLIQNVRFFDNRILTIDEPDTERFVTSEKKNLLVDSFVKWRIEDVRQYYISMNGDEARARSRLTQIINSVLREEIGKAKASLSDSAWTAEQGYLTRRLKAEIAGNLFGVDARYRVDLTGDTQVDGALTLLPQAEKLLAEMLPLGTSPSRSAREPDDANAERRNR